MTHPTTVAAPLVCTRIERGCDTWQKPWKAAVYNDGHRFAFARAERDGFGHWKPGGLLLFDLRTGEQREVEFHSLLALRAAEGDESAELSALWNEHLGAAAN